MKVTRAMTHQIHLIKPQTTVREAALIIIEHKIAGLPVVDEKEQLVGIVSEKDILQTLFPSMAEFMLNRKSWWNFEKMENQLRDRGSVKVEEIMTKKVYTVSPEAPVMKAVSLMLRKHIRRLPVVDGGKVVGLISKGDAFQALFREHLNL